MNTTGQVSIRAWLALPPAERAARTAAFREADQALQDNDDTWESPESLRLNRAVNDLWPTVPWWIRDPSIPHPGTRTQAALYFLYAVAALALIVLLALTVK